MADILRREAVYLWYYFDLQLRQIFPYWMLGMVLGPLISAFVKDRIHGLFARMRKREWGVLGVVPASLLGIASPLCMYGTIPIAASFARQGMRADFLAAFMMSSVLLNPQLMIYSTALGAAAFWIRFVSCFLCGAGAGLCVWLFYRDVPFFGFDSFGPPISHDLQLIKLSGIQSQQVSAYLLRQAGNHSRRSRVTERPPLY